VGTEEYDLGYGYIRAENSYKGTRYLGYEPYSIGHRYYNKNNDYNQIYNNLKYAWKSAYSYMI